MSRPWYKPPPEGHGSEEIVGPGGFSHVSDAVVSAVDHAHLSVKLAPRCESPIEIEFGARLLRQLRGTDLTLAPQYEWLRFRIDFALMRGDTPVVFIECDGKEFHSTSEQLANDRRKDAAAARAGIPLLRFSGSDIFRRSIACAELAIAEANR